MTTQQSVEEQRTPTGLDLDEIIQQMLVDYTAWVNGEPIAWNVKKAQAKQALTRWGLEQRIDELETIKKKLTPVIVHPNDFAAAMQVIIFEQVQLQANLQDGGK